MNNNKLRLIYILPNLFTAGSIFLAILSIISASKGDIEKAGWFIVLASIFDALDGRVARLTKTTSHFGVEFDSLADAISFGVAPAMLFYFYTGNDFGRFGTMATALYAIFAAVRLARFNVSTQIVEPNVFIGLPSPAAALLVVSWTLAFNDGLIHSSSTIVLPFLVIASGILMVSNIRYPSFKKIDMGPGYFLKILIIIIVALSLIYLYPLIMIIAITSIYALFGPIRALIFILKKKRQKNEQ